MRWSRFAFVVWPAAANGANLSLALHAAMEKDSECSDINPHISETGCLVKNEGKCMWLQLDQRNLCLPCAIGQVDIPCVPPGASFPEGRVHICSMGCKHQLVMTKVSPCTDVSGEISRSDCQAKGDSGDAKCMWTAYKTQDGRQKQICGPCLVDHFGNVPPFLVGGLGPEEGSRVEGSWSACDVVKNEYGLPCDPENGVPAITPCRPVRKPADPLQPVALNNLHLTSDPGAPYYVAVPVEAPYDVDAYIHSATVGARVAEWPAGSVLPPSVPVAVYAAPPPGAPPPPKEIRVVYKDPPPGLRGLYRPTSPPGAEPALLEAAAAGKKKESLLARLRRNRKPIAVA